MRTLTGVFEVMDVYVGQSGSMLPTSSDPRWPCQLGWDLSVYLSDLLNDHRLVELNESSLTSFILCLNSSRKGNKLPRLLSSKGDGNGKI